MSEEIKKILSLLNSSSWSNELCENIREQAKSNIIKTYSSRRKNYGKC